MIMAYYYFDFSEAEKRTLDSFLRSLIVQLTVGLAEIPQDLAHLHARCRDQKQEPSTESLKEVLHVMLMKNITTIVAIDALDECSDPEELVTFLGEMRSWNADNLRLLLVSRQHFEGADGLEELQPVRVSIQNQIANTDISTFVQEILNKDFKLKRWPVQVKAKIESALVSKSSGM